MVRERTYENRTLPQIIYKYTKFLKILLGEKNFKEYINLDMYVSKVSVNFYSQIFIYKL